MTDIVESKFWSRVDRRSPAECWAWTGPADAKSRGRISIDGKSHVAPRVSWMIHHGVMPPPHVFVCHSCDNPNCVNPAHLWLGDAKDNARDAASKGRSPMQQQPHKSFFATPQSNAHRPKGEGHANSIVNDDLVKWIRDNYRPRHAEFGAAAISRKLGLHKDTVQKIVQRRAWKHV